MKNLLTLFLLSLGFIGNSYAESFQCSDVITEEILEYERTSGCTLPKDIWVCKEGFSKSDDEKQCIRDT